MFRITFEIQRIQKQESVCIGCGLTKKQRTDLGWSCRKCFSFNPAVKPRKRAKLIAINTRQAEQERKDA